MIRIPKWLGIIMLILGLVMVFVTIISGAGSGGPVTFILSILYFAIPLYILMKDD